MGILPFFPGKKEFVHENIQHEEIESVMHYKESIHADAAECYDCHGAHDMVGTESPDSPVHKKNLVSTCESCHAVDKTHDWLPYLDSHLEALSCESCHIPQSRIRELYLRAEALRRPDQAVQQGTAES